MFVYFCDSVAYVHRPHPAFSSAIICHPSLAFSAVRLHIRPSLWPGAENRAICTEPANRAGAWPYRKSKAKGAEFSGDGRLRGAGLSVFVAQVAARGLCGPRPEAFRSVSPPRDTACVDRESPDLYGASP